MIFGVLFGFQLLFFLKSVYLVKQIEVIIIQSFGRYHKTLTPGLHLIVPFIDAPHVCYWTYVQQADNGRYYRFQKQYLVLTYVNLYMIFLSKM